MNMRIVDSRTNSLRQRRRALNPYNDKSKEDCSFEMGGYSIGACIILLFFIGFSVTASYLTTACSEFPSSLQATTTSLRTSSPKPPTTPAAAAKAPPPKAAPVSNTPPQPVSMEGFPAACTDEQNNKALQMLPSEPCLQPPFKQACSFTKATTKPCRDPYWMREFYATTDLKSQFNAVFVGYTAAVADYAVTPIDLLHIGSRNPHYARQRTLWEKSTGHPGCQRSVEERGDVRDAKVVLVLSPDQSQDAINHFREKLEIKPEMLETVPDDPQVDDAFLNSKLSSEDAPIHYMRILPLSTARYGTMKQMTRWSSVWYLEMTLDWKTGMTKDAQKELLTEVLPGKGFVCYWAGNDSNLWRITNCWQEHYKTPTWANVACVNARIPDAKPLLDKMEKMFVETLAKDITFQ